MESPPAESSAAAAARSAMTDTHSSPVHSSPGQSVSHDFFKSWDQEHARQSSKFKTRSLTTLRDEHLPQVLGASQAISVVLLGDSMIERMATTGKTRSLQLWPSETMYTENDLLAENSRRHLLRLPELVRINGALNAGCGGDQIQNVLWRLVGDPKRDIMGLAEALSSSKRKHKIKLWVIQAGTNSLHRKKGLTDKSVETFRLLLESILDFSDEAVHILVTGLFYRKDIPNSLVDEANAKLQKLVRDLELEIAPEDEEVEESPTSGGVSHFNFATRSTAPQVVDVKGKGKAVDPEERRDSAVGIPITPAVTYESVDIKGNGKAKQELLGTQVSNVDEGTESQQLPGRDPTLPQFKPNAWSSTYLKDPEAAGVRPKYPKGTSPIQRSSGQDTGYYYPSIQFLPAPWTKDMDSVLEDSVHLNEFGYRFWMRSLLPKVKEMLAHAEKASP